MIVTFEETYLRCLYEKGSTDDKKHRYQPQIIRGYQKGIKFMKFAKRPDDLRRINSLNFEALHGDKEGKFWVICKSPWIKVDMVALFLPQDVAQL